MDSKSLFDALLAASTTEEVRTAVETFEAAKGEQARWAPIGGKENNRGPIEVSADPGRSLVERLTNGIDAILEAECERHRGVPDCRSPREAATAWLGISERGLSEMTPAQRQAVARRVVTHLLPGDGRQGRLIEIRDLGVGLTPEEMPETILSLNESNKIRKHYLAGTYGQGGSSTFAISAYTLLASRHANDSRVAFTVVKFLDLPPEEYKTGHYVYLTVDGIVPIVEGFENDFAAGTLVRHFGYDLSSYPSPVGPNSVYGLLNQVLFDPVLPIWLDSEVHGYRRVIKGSRNALNGAVDEGDETRRGPALDHNMPTFYLSLGDFGNVGFEYWVLERPTRANKRPSAAFVNPSRPIILTLNGQNHAELPVSIVRKEAEFHFLSQRLIVHIDCDSLTPTAKRALFASSREDARRGLVLQLIHDELVRILKSDDELVRLNNEAREQGMRERDETAVQEMRREVAHLLHLQGIEIDHATGARVGGDRPSPDYPTRPRGPRRQLQPIEVHEPPTYIRIVWEEGEPIDFYPSQRRYVRLETDANSNYYDPDNPTNSRINIIIVQGPVMLKGSTPLRGGRMRAILELPDDTPVGATGTLRVELSRLGLPTLSDQRGVVVREAPPSRPGRQPLSLPPFDPRPVQPDDEQWATLGWPDDVAEVASSAVMENGTLVIYYSTAYPKYASQVTRYEQRDPSVAESFKKRYEIWLVTHSLLYHRDQEEVAAQHPTSEEVDTDLAEERERQERLRMATLAALFAAREVELAAMSQSAGETYDS
ncbi:MAG: hypothetical protein C3F12_10895 [Candidatus Methylomirabilota bacterium]|nr:hypothetical protein [candidate division NC10 bacterium]PWB44507.1 MAG: hypothetical protein C3F12_10895 [candidate division NC10 bacterium]